MEFEGRLERLFSEAPLLADADGFAQRLERRLERGWAARRLLIGAAGVVGGVIGASQLFLSNFAGRMEAASEGSAKIIASGLRQVAPHAQWLTALPAGGPVVWVASAMAVLALGFALTRAIEEI
jgi:hypothetical protein